MVALRTIYVYADWYQLKNPTLMGTLSVQSVRGSEIFSFEYYREWLDSQFAFLIDADLQQYAGPQYINDDSKPNFGMFMDSAPDRWGRVLLNRKEAELAKTEGRPAAKLFDSDYLLGVYDGARSGGLRFKTSPDGEFLNDDRDLGVPPIASIRTLEHASMMFEKDEAPNDQEYMRNLNLLINAGSSLGGARPKANVLDSDGSLWIAKFPSKNDQHDSGAWEMVVHDLALACKIVVPDAKKETYNSEHHTYFSKRFDRAGFNRRVHYASAMTMLGLTDGADASSGVSYLDIVGFIIVNSAKPNDDLEELFKRIAFSISISNTDDHLRNHGFILTAHGWRLSPAFDINPNRSGTGLSLNIDSNNNALDIDLLLSTSEYYRLSNESAIEIIKNISDTVKQWQNMAKSHGLSNSAIDSMAPAFNYQAL
jgi:serine/threonine-protein kinase HipA